MAIFVDYLFLKCNLSCIITNHTSIRPEQYDRGKGKPEEIVKTFTVSNPDAEFTLSVENGDEAQGGVSSAVITLNGVVVVSPDEFSQQVSTITKPVELNEQNEIGVEVRSKPGTSIVVTVFGPDNVKIPDNPNGVYDLFLHPKDPRLFQFEAEDGSLVQYYAEKDSEGFPLFVPRMLVSGPDTLQTVEFDTEGRPTEIRNEGGTISIKWLSDELVQVTFVTPTESGGHSPDEALNLKTGETGVVSILVTLPLGQPCEAVVG